MSTAFDPYHRWLGIPPKHLPADYYRLLGLERFEADPEVIADAAERQIAHVRRYALGPHQDISQRILNELAAAKVCLLNPDKKAEYDRKLREQVAAQEQAASPAVPPSVSPLPPLVVPTRARPDEANRGKNASPRTRVSRRLVGRSGLVSRARLPETLFQTFQSVRLPILIGVGGGLLLVLIVILMILFSKPSNDAEVTSSPPSPSQPQPPLIAPTPQPEPARAEQPQAVEEPGQPEAKAAQAASTTVKEAVAEPKPNPLPAVSKWLDAPRQRGGIRDTLSIGVAKAWLEEADGKPTVLSVEVLITNRSPDRPLEFSGWRPGDQPQVESQAAMIDDAGAMLQSAPVRPTAGRQPARRRIAPAASTSEQLSFVFPDNESKYFRLMLPYAALGQTGCLGFELPRQMIGKKPSDAKTEVMTSDEMARRRGQIDSFAKMGRAEEEKLRPLPAEPPPDLENSIGMKFKLIPAGEFLMGSPDGDSDAAAYEKPQHLVRITKPFYLGVTEVTQEQYERVMGQNPSHFKGDPQRPVERVSWEDAVAFCGKLSEKEGQTYRLPTEAEWEYACRAGHTNKWSFGDDEAGLTEHAWFNENSDETTHPVAQKKPNAFGLYDTHGNVCEWSADLFGPYSAASSDDPKDSTAGSSFAIRGGAWATYAKSCRCACRSGNAPDYRSSLFGFRVASSLVDAPSR